MLGLRICICATPTAQKDGDRDSNLLVLPTVITASSVEPTFKIRLKDGLASFPVIPGISGGIILDLLRSNIIKDVFTITDEQAIDMAHQLAEREGLFCGISSGANVLAALQVADTLGKDARAVTVLPDSRDRYLSLEKYTT